MIILETLQWTDTRRGETFMLTTLNVRLFADGHLAVKADSRPTNAALRSYAGTVGFLADNRRVRRVQCNHTRPPVSSPGFRSRRRPFG